MSVKLTTAAGVFLALLFACSGAAAAALTAAPQPVKPVATTLYSGRWYEIARTPNKMQTDCQGSTNDFSGWSSGNFAVVQTCHKGSAHGPTQTFNAKGRILPASENAKIKLGYFGGLISQEYWILDHADDDQSWALMATPGGRFLLLLSRLPTTPAPIRQVAVTHIAALGYNVSHLKASR